MYIDFSENNKRVADLMVEFLQFVTENCTYDELLPPMSDKTASDILDRYIEASDTGTK